QQITIGEETFKVIPADSVEGSYETVTVGNLTYALVPIEPASTIYPQIPQTDSPVDLDPIALSQLTVGSTGELGADFWPPFFAGIFYNVITTVNLAWAILGMTIFRGSILGLAWGLLLVGVALNATADIAYDFTSIYYYDRTNPTIPLWVFGCMIISYALYVHRKSI
ncbi:MAG TPA: hypothetical protein VLA68_01225, partial [Nitrososphaera sp.]|nr:hypothetical protein [Nitrososphaera sp.]